MRPCCASPTLDSRCDSYVVAGVYEQTEYPNLQDIEPTRVK